MQAVVGFVSYKGIRVSGLGAPYFIQNGILPAICFSEMVPWASLPGTLVQGTVSLKFRSSYSSTNYMSLAAIPLPKVLQ